jgi:hypothetical protein
MTMATRVPPEPEPPEVPAWELEVKPESDEPLRAFLMPADDEDEPPFAPVPAAV